MDTGAGGTVINSAITQKLHLESFDSELLVAGPGGTSNTKLVAIDELRTQLKSLTDYMAPTIPFPIFDAIADGAATVIRVNDLRVDPSFHYKISCAFWSSNVVTVRGVSISHFQQLTTNGIDHFGSHFISAFVSPD